RALRMVEKSEGRATARPKKIRHDSSRALRMNEKSANQKITPTKVGAQKSVSNYGLKPIAWF
ncbi:MAG: hypothetical protein N3B10_01790, partial [Armatimonadetes bacterium]|nr:hypothetical protein [Armatimonadota bacterium]